MGLTDRFARNADTYDRSCAHWSEEGRRGMEQFYALAGEDYRQLATVFDWVAYLKHQQSRVKDRRVRLLDVACGSGKFPSALHRYGGLADAALAPIDYDLLDPSAFSRAEARGALRPPFEPGRDHACPLQELRSISPGYDVVWAVHALYALPPSELREGLRRLVESIAAGGAGFIAHAREESHYLAFYRAYLEGMKGGRGTPFVNAEHIIDTLADMGIAYESTDIEYEGRAPTENSSDVEGYLQRCLFDDTVSLEDMIDHRALGPYLATCRDARGWRFRQQVSMVFFSV